MDHNVRRIGILAPPANVALERELPRWLPPGVVMNHNRLTRLSAQVTKEDLLAMNASVERAALDLAFARPEVIAYACTSGSFLEGQGAEGAVGREIEALTGIPAFTTSEAVVAALRALGARTVFMITPYPDAVNVEEAAFLAHYGFDVRGHDAFGCATSAEIRALSSEMVADLARAHRADLTGCDALFISCTNLLTLCEIDRLEEELGVAVVSSNQSTLWMALERLGVAAPGGPGRLFRL